MIYRTFYKSYCLRVLIGVELPLLSNSQGALFKKLKNKNMKPISEEGIGVGAKLSPIEDSFNWIKRNIESCTHPFQLDCCYTLVVLFKVKYEDSDIEFSKFYDNLNMLILNKQTFFRV